MGSLWSLLKRIFWFLGGCICYTPSPGVPLPSADQTAASPEFCAELRERFNPRRHKNVADRLPPPRRFRINENFLVYGSADDRPREGARELAGPRQPVGPAGGLASTGATRGKTGFVEAGTGSPPIINGALVQEMADIETENSLSSNGSEQEKIRGPYTVLELSRNGSVHGYRQTNGPVGYGFFMGVRLRDFGDFVKRHYVRDTSPLSVTKSWEIQQFGETEDEVVDPLDVITSRFQSSTHCDVAYSDVAFNAQHVEQVPQEMEAPPRLL
eukprot:XP_028344269.1 uncharacterized protein LOC114486137 [Physeter catodon]